MAEEESRQFPEEAEKTVYQRDKTAREPRVQAREGEEAKPKPRPPIKPRKVFVPKKIKARTDKPMEHRTRHILVSSRTAAEALRQILIEFQEELAAQPSEDPDKIFEDYDKTERFFKRLARKYSLCPSRLVGGDLDWIYRGMPVPETISPEVLEAIMKAERMTIPPPVQSHLGHHILLVCETRVSKRAPQEKKDEMDPRLKAMLERERSETRVPGKDMQIPG